MHEIIYHYFASTFTEEDTNGIEVMSIPEKKVIHELNGAFKRHLNQNVL